MNMLTFKRGIHPLEKKELTQSIKIDEYTPKGEVAILLLQHIGAPCEALVKKGDRVLVGQKIGESKSAFSAPVHASVSGTVKSVEPRLQTDGTKTMAVVIENDNLYEELELTKNPDFTKLSKDELVNIIKEAGIVGIGGACFPTHIKLSPQDDSKIDHIIINACECEPYLTSNHRIMLELPDEIACGLSILHHMFPKTKIVIGIEDNKKDAIELMRKSIKDLSYCSVSELITKYPQGGEKQLIETITGRQVPSGKLPSEVGCIVQNINTVLAIKEAVVDGKPLTKKIVTVTGNIVNNPRNLKVPLGTNLSELIDHCGGVKEEIGKVISGGPMTGFPLVSLDIPCLKSTSGLVFFSKKEARFMEQSNCIRCGRCITTCPMFLNPQRLNSLVLVKKYEEFEKNNGMDCIECGCCSYGCPAKRYLTQSIKEGKKTVMQNRKKGK